MTPALPLQSDRERPAGLRERRKARTRAQIQEQALRLFTDQGYEATTVEQIAAAAEVSLSTLFRYFATKSDIVRYDPFDPIVFDAYRAQPPGLSPMAALRRATASLLEAVPPALVAEQLARARLVLSVPELRTAVLDDTREVTRLFAEAEEARTGRRPDPFRLRVLVGAVMGALVAALRAETGDVEADFTAALDRAFVLLEEGLPL